MNVKTDLLFVRVSLLILILVSASDFLTGEDFRFFYREGDRFRILSEVQQNVYINENYQYSTEMLNRIQVEILRTEGERGFLRGSVSAFGGGA
jgi:hypothetical protein